MRRTVFSLAGLVVATQVVIPDAAADRCAPPLGQRCDLVLCGLVVLAGIVTRRGAGHIVRAVSFFVHEDVSLKDRVYVGVLRVFTG